jgi:hypothetical protein
MGSAVFLPTVIPNECEESRFLLTKTCQGAERDPSPAVCGATCTPGTAPLAGQVCIRSAVQVIL